MSPERSNAYRRVMKTLEDMGPSKLLDSEQQRIRYAADNLVFAADLCDRPRGPARRSPTSWRCAAFSSRAGAGRRPPRAGWPRMCRGAGRTAQAVLQAAR